MQRKRECITTTLLYQNDSHLVEFTARVLGQREDGGKHLLTLAETAFYPTSGGQPHDSGTIGGVDVLDVYEAAGQIIHVVDGTIDNSEEVLGIVHWPRRHDHMQQHTGQHILSQALVQVCDIPTVGFTIGPDWSTIVLERKPDDAQMEDVLKLANAVVDEDRKVDVLLPSPSEIEELPIRGALPEKEIIRIVRVEGFDWSPCGGTHCKTTSDVRMIIVLGIHKEKDTYRLEFVCGRRAEAIALRQSAVVSRVAALLDVGSFDIVERTRSLLDKVHSQEQTIDELRNARLSLDRDRLLATIGERDDGVIAEFLEGSAVQEIRQLAHMLVDRKNTVAILVGRDTGKVGVAFARSDDRIDDMNHLMRRVCEETGCRGGGNPQFASGGGGADVDPETVLEVAKRCLESPKQ